MAGAHIFHDGFRGLDELCIQSFEIYNQCGLFGKLATDLPEGITDICNYVQLFDIDFILNKVPIPFATISTVYTRVKDPTFLDTLGVFGIYDCRV